MALQCPDETHRVEVIGGCRHWRMSMKPLLIVTLGIALATGACGTATSDTADAPSETTETPLSSGDAAAPADPPLQGRVVRLPPDQSPR